MTRAGELYALAERCEAAAGPDRELDKLIHEHLFGTSMGTFPGGKVGGPFYLAPDGRGMGAPFAFTGHVEDAEWAMPDDGGFPEWQITRRLPTGYHANVGVGNDGAGCETPALALCAAALRVRAASGTLTEGGDVEQAPSDSLSGPTGNAGDAQ